jgi:hypothetical protein
MLDESNNKPGRWFCGVKYTNGRRIAYNRSKAVYGGTTCPRSSGVSVIPIQSYSTPTLSLDGGSGGYETSGDNVRLGFCNEMNCLTAVLHVVRNK